jgi:energy-coupling factor transport system substrate-specific component
MKSFKLVIFVVTVLICAAAGVLSGNPAAAMLSVSVAAIAVLTVVAGRRKSPLYLSLTAVLTALSIVGRAVFAPVSGFKPCTAVIITAGATLGADAGFLCGALTALISNVWFGQGVWTVFQMISWGLIGFAAGIFSSVLKKRRTVLLIFGAASGFVYSAVMDLFSVVWQDGGVNPVRFAAYAASSLPFACVYAVSNVIFLLILFKKLDFSISRIKRKYGMDSPWQNE